MVVIIIVLIVFIVYAVCGGVWEDSKYEYGDDFEDMEDL